MLSRFGNSIITFFAHLRTTSNPLFHSEAKQQLQYELARAILEKMVSTRSQENTPPSNDRRGLSVNGSPPASTKKRKAERSSETIPSKAATKRRKESATKATLSVVLVSNGRALTSAPQLVQPTPNQIAPQDNKISERDTSSSGKTAPVVASLQPAEIASTPTDVVDSRAGTSTDLDEIPEKCKASKKGRRAHSPDLASESPAVETLPNPPKAIHKRFDNKDLNPSNLTPSSTNIEDPSIVAPLKEHVEGKDEADSSDEAPEIVTASAGLNQARAAVSEAAKVAKRYCHISVEACTEITKIRQRSRSAKAETQRARCTVERTSQIVQEAPKTAHRQLI